MIKESEYSLGYAIAQNMQSCEDKISRLEKQNSRLKKQLEKKEDRETAFEIWLTREFNRTQDTIYLDVLLKYGKILERVRK